MLKFDDMTTLKKWHRRIFGSLHQCVVSLLLSASVLPAADAGRSADLSQMAVTMVGSDSDNLFFMAINTSVDLPRSLNIRDSPPGVMITNGVYSIAINASLGASASEEILSAGMGMTSLPLDMNQALAIYAELTGCELEVDEDVRHFAGLLKFPRHSEMTRSQACELFEAGLIKQAGLEISKPDNHHAIVKFRTK